MILGAFNTFLTVLGIGGLALAYFAFKGKRWAILAAAFCGISYFLVYALDLGMIFPVSPDKMPPALLAIEVAGILVSFPLTFLSLRRVSIQVSDFGNRKRVIRLGQPASRSLPIKIAKGKLFMSGKENSSSKAKKGFLEVFLTIFGDIKVYNRPLFLVYDPGSYLVKGEDIREIIREIQPGDILVRKYKNYLDGFFIPGYFSHVGLYLGPVSKKDVDLVPLEQGKKQFKSGDQMVIHALAEGVLMEDLLTFCRTDYLAILRFPEKIKRAPEPRLLSVPPKEYLTEEEEIQKRIEDGEEIQFKEIFPIIYKVALKNLGRPYDFNFNFADFARLSCTEFVYLCTKCMGSFLNVLPKKKRVFLFFNKSMIQPDDFFSTKLEIIWGSFKLDHKKLESLRKG